VARGGIEPPTPGFSGLGLWGGIDSADYETDTGSEPAKRSWLAQNNQSQRIAPLALAIKSPGSGGQSYSTTAYQPRLPWAVPISRTGRWPQKQLRWVAASGVGPKPKPS